MMNSCFGVWLVVEILSTKEQRLWKGHTAYMMRFTRYISSALLKKALSSSKFPWFGGNRDRCVNKDKGREQYC